ncbi:E3 ubiquitin-protein ligase HUWE1 [Rhizoctonia solani AG-1 IB]|uniref:HECT-type E3 ubiquitin transferase n=1 Tax=Thanatephorus cucumeris (strain AG1-IB / isolate 7/3/14) TaxID=1108050 RepID=A0A0B7FSN0_THACB|nr:E3 ubiquitin-protein ligase HUWE1 [Rhizoctonia solani AG-1 IB]
MKIQKQSKKVGQPHPEVAALISTLIATPQSELAQFIGNISLWTWPRSDLNSWTKVLNRFDAIFSDLIDKYDLNKLQLSNFDEADKKLLLELLRFERMLLENSTNRKLFASYDRLNAFLATSDLDVLVGVLQLLLRPSQQYSSQPPTPHSLNISAPRLQALAMRWPGLREAGIELHELLDKPAQPVPIAAKAKAPETGIRFGFGTSSSGFATPTQVATGTSTPRAGLSSSGLVPNSGDVTFQFYRKTVSATQTQEPKVEPSNPEQTPTRASGSRSASSSNPFSPSRDPPTSGPQTGMTVVRLTDLQSSTKDYMQIVTEAVQKYDIPDEEVFELMCRIRIARVLGPNQESAREKLACVRLLAIAIFAHTQSETLAQQQLFLYEPDLTHHLAELIHHDRNVPVWVQVAAVNALDGIARYRHRSTEVLAAVNANVSHGILMGSLRKAVDEIAKPNSPVPNEFPEALLGFITYLASQSAGGTQVVGAGLVPQLILLVENRQPERMTVVSKAMPLIDNLLYGFPTAFQLFVNAHGVEAMVERILHEVTTGIELYGALAKASPPSAGTSSLLPFVNSSLLKHIVRSMHRMMQSSGTAEGLRTLIDSSLVKSIKLIMENKILFGPPIYSIAINIMAMFVHNEPTSLAILQEANVPEVFYGAIESGIEPAIEAITSVPNAIGALCLNQTGLNQFNEHKAVMPTFFSMFTSEPHIKVLLEKDNANAIGGAIDELVRHHPSLKDVVFESIIGTMQKIESLGNSFQIPKDQENLYRMISTTSPQSADPSQEPLAASSSAWLPTGQESALPSGAVTPAAVPEPEETEPAKPERTDNVIASFIDILCRFLDGMFQHIPHCQEFVDSTDGLDRLGHLYTLPCLPLGYGSSLAADSMVQLLRSMTEVSATKTLESLTKQVQLSLEETKAFWQEPSDKSRLAQLMERAVHDNIDEANAEYRKLFTLHLRVNLLADIYTTVGYSHSRGGPPLIQTLTGPDSGDILPKLGALHRAFVWEHAALKSALAAQGVKNQSNSATESEELLSLNRPQDGTPYHDASANDASNASTSGGNRSAKAVNEQNSHLMRHLAEMLPSALAPFFHAVVKVLAPSRRISDPEYRKQGFNAALVVAGILKEHLTWRPSPDLHATYAYATVMLNLLQILIFDERQSAAVQTVLLIAFFRVDGQERVVELVNNCLNAADHIFATPEQDQTSEQKSELIYVLGSIKIALGLLHPLVSSSPMFESPQTTQLTTHGKDESDEDYFEPHAFLIRSRATFIPVATRLWNSPWLPKTIPDLIKGVVNTVLEIMKGDREETPPDTTSSNAFTEFLRSRAFMQPPAPRPVDEVRLQTLMDMGFSREAATRALIIGGNNMTRATDYLLTHGEIAEGEGASNEPAAPPPAEASSSMQTDGPEENESDPVPEENKSDKGKEKDDAKVVARDWAKELQEARQALRPDIGPRLLALADKDPQLVFDLKSAFIGSSNSYQASCLDSLFESLGTLAPKDSAFATRCRLLAVVLNTAGADDYVPPDEKVRGLTDYLLSIFVKPLDSSVDWLAGYLLAIEVLLVISDEIAPVQLPKDEEPVPTVALRTNDISATRRTAFKLCLEILPLSTLTSDDLLAVFRLLIILTRDHSLADEFLSSGGLQQLLSVFNDPSKEISNGQIHSLIILRHIIESPQVLKQIMVSEVKKAFPSNRNRPTEVTAFVNTCRGAALRDPEAFLATAKHLCEMTTPIRPGSSQNYVALSTTTAVAGEAEQASSESSSGPKAGPDLDERLIQYLVNELHRAGRVALEALAEDTTPSSITKPSPPDTSMAVDEARATTPTPATTTAQSAEPVTTAPHSDYLYTCFLLQCLAELLLSYPSCKIAFIAAGKKKMSTPSRDGGKSKSTILSFLLSDLLSFGKIYGQPSEKAKRRIVMSRCAMEVILALCTSPMSQQAPTDLKDLPSDIVHVRKTVLEVLGKAIKDTSSVNPIEARYARLISHAELCSLLLTPQPTLSSKPVQDDVTIHLAKIMLEKNFVGTLTGVLGDLDLNYPNVKSLISAILRPLEYLSKVAIKMGRSDKNKTSLAVDEESETSSSMSVDDDEEEESEVEAANDLYRNSALGMFSGEMEDQYAQDEEMDDSEEEGDEVEMEFGDEDTGTDLSDQTSDDEEDDINAEGELAIAEGDEWEDEDEEMTDADEDDEDSDEDSEDDAGLTWDGGVTAAEAIGDTGPDGELEREMDDMAAVDLQAALEEDGDDAEPTSDDEENALEQVDAIPVGDEDMALDWDGQQPGMQILNGRSFFMSADDGHRSRLIDDGEALFGRGRGVAAAPSLGVSSHPLLENPESTRANNPAASRSSRRSARGGPPAVRGAFNEMLQVIDNMIGGEGAQLMQHLLSQHPVPPGSTLDITTNPSGGGAAIMASLTTQPHRHGSSRHDRHANESREVPEFLPMTTSQRWQDETNITHHRFTNERLRKISDHLILALLPTFREKVRKEKEAEKERAEKAEREREEAERIAKEEAERAKPVTSEPAPVPEEPVSVPTPTAESATEAPATQTEDVVMDDSPAEPKSTNATEAPAPEASSVQMEVDAQASGSGSGGEAPATTNPEAPTEPPAEPQRVIVHIHGNEVDITDTGIDPTFLEALPDDMREEVLNQHVREQRATEAIQPRLEDTQISAEFLDALPPDIRAEILMQESAEQARMERTRARAAEQTATGGPSDIDPASFLASLDPQLRQAVLLEQDDGFLQTLPSAMIAEATSMRDTYSGRRYVGGIPRGTTSGTRHEPPAPRKPAAPRDSIQLLDKNGISALVRLLFFPQFPPRKSNLHKILVNLCENSKTREDLFVLLLGILQDGTADVATVDQSFSQMSVAKASTSPTKSMKSASASQEPNPLFAHLNGENIPNLVAQRCLDTLGLIVQANERSSLYFLTEHELPAGMKRASSSRKGKGKEKHAPQTHFPVVQLLGLLDRPNILNSPAMLDSIASLLASISKPLASLKTNPPTQAQAQTQTQTETQTPATESAAPAPPPASDNAPTDSSAAPTDGSTENKASDQTATKEPGEETPESILRTHPPQIPHHNFRLIVNILTAGEVSGKTFTNTLVQIQHVSALSGARDVIASELKSKAQEFGMILHNDLDDLAKALEEAEASKDVRGPAIAKFSSASSDQAKLLRILKMIDLMYAPKEGQDNDPGTADEEKVAAIYEDFRFQGLWRRLGDCLAVVEQKPDLEHIATVLLPLIEALMVVCKHVKPQSTGRSHSQSLSQSQRALMSPLSPSAPRVSASDLFVEFTDAHRKVLNLMVRNNPSLMGGSFSLLVQNPRVLDFDNKRNWFNQQLRKRSRDAPHGTLQLNLRRPHVFEDSFQNLQRKTGEQIKYGKLSVRFYNEEGVDAGGVTREWFQILARQMFNPDYALFQPCAADKLTFQPNRASMVNPEHLSFFKFVGRVIGKAIYDGRLMDAHFARSLYRQILGKPVDYRDVEWVDPDYYKSLIWILENDPTVLETTFTVEAEEFGVHKVVPLKENGEKIMVTEENKKEFVQLSAQYRLYTSIKDQIEALLAGFYDIIPKELISIFNEQELELLISGTPDIDIDEWRAATDYNGYNPSDPAIVWWWRALKSFDREERAKVLSFATGTSRVPLEGFKDLQGVQGTQRFSIHRAYGESDRLPQAHTCFNQIDLPQYSSYEKLRTQVLLAINEGGEGFGFA